MHEEVSTRVTALNAIHEASVHSTGLVTPAAWEALVNIAWDNQGPGDRRKIKAEIVRVLDQVAIGMKDANEDS